MCSALLNSVVQRLEDPFNFWAFFHGAVHWTHLVELNVGENEQRPPPSSQSHPSQRLQGLVPKGHGDRSLKRKCR